MAVIVWQPVAHMQMSFVNFINVYCCAVEDVVKLGKLICAVVVVNISRPSVHALLFDRSCNLNSVLSVVSALPSLMQAPTSLCRIVRGRPWHKGWLLTVIWKYQIWLWVVWDVYGRLKIVSVINVVDNIPIKAKQNQSSDAWEGSQHCRQYKSVRSSVASTHAGGCAQ